MHWVAKRMPISSVPEIIHAITHVRCSFYLARDALYNLYLFQYFGGIHRRNEHIIQRLHTEDSVCIFENKWRNSWLTEDTSLLLSPKLHRNAGRADVWHQLHLLLPLPVQQLHGLRGRQLQATTWPCAASSSTRVKRDSSPR
ncbi:uncharacterized protein LOC142768695 isoform X3 [Rhipicephalus microplus]|uniref:uncharacterized protein LOC142768695 isoform X3 n=1 Tax=Rhipicephalus microplus TaxID=6941 RepID=UPI003F6B63B4